MIQQQFKSFCRFLYGLLGPENSTRLSQSLAGKYIFSLMVGKKNKSGIYEGSDGIRLRLTYKEAIDSGFIHLGVINPHETALIKKILKENDAFIDIGAYVDGWHSIVAGKLVGKGGTVYTFEPVPEYCKKLRYNITLNKLHNVTIEEIAISDNNGRQTFYIGGLASTLYKKHLGNTGHHKVTVKTMTLDSYIKLHSIKRVALVKIDAEGAEMDVLRGATKLLKSSSAPDLLIEVSDVYLKHGNTSENDVLTFLKKLGYTSYSITDKGLGKYRKKRDGRELMNVYFSKKNKRSLPVVS